MPATAKVGYNTRVYINTGSAYIEIPLPTDVQVFGKSVDQIDTTNQAGDGYREFIGGLKDWGSLTFTVFFDPTDTTHEYLLDNVGAVRPVRVVSGQYSQKVEGNALITGELAWSAPMSGAQTLTVTLKWTGDLTISAST